MKTRVDPPKLKRLDSTELLREKVYNTLLEHIVEGELAPGEQLMEQTIADGLGVSKSPVRDALYRLNADGLVVSTPFRGCVVSPLSAAEFIDLMQVRMAIEFYCLEQKIDSYSDEDVREFSLLAEGASKFLSGDEVRLAHDSHLGFHDLVVRKLGNKLMTDTYAINQKKLKRYLRINVSLTQERIRISDRYHVKMIEAIRRRDKAAVLRLLKEHFADIRKAFLQGWKTRQGTNDHELSEVGPGSAKS